MTADRITVSFDASIGQAVREAAEREGISVSGWLSDAATRRLRTELLAVALDRWLEEDGPLTEEERRAADEALGFEPDVRSSIEAA